jgi:nucleolar protein 53
MKATKSLRRKTKAAREKAKRNAQEALERAQKQLERLNAHQLQSVKTLVKQLDKKDEEHQRAVAEKQLRKAMKKAVKTAKLSKLAYKPLPMTVQLSEDLAESLRELKPEGNVFTERFNNLQKRCLIETRVPVTQHRRYKLKEYEKHSYKKFQ